MGQRIEVKRKPKARGVPSMLGAAVYLLDRALMVAAAAVAVAVFYLLQTLISGSAAAFPKTLSGTPLSPAVREQFMHGLRVASYVFMAGLCGITIVSIFRFRENDVAGYVGGLGGIVCYFALPWLVRSALIHHNANPNLASDFMLGSFRAAGKLLLIITAIYFAAKVIIRLARRPTRAAAASAPIILESDQRLKPTEKISRRRTLLRKCWELSMCRESLHDNCPSYKLGVTCWKRGTGCQCDPALAQRLIEELEFKLRGEMPDKERVARERMKEQIGYRIAENEGESYCHQCPIYNEHQYYKYKGFYWIAYPITAALVFLLMPVIDGVYRWVDVGMAAMLDSLQMLPHTDAALRPFVRSVYNFNAEFIFIISAALMIAAYLLDLVDYAVFKAKI